jgi:hypothetical protein
MLAVRRRWIRRRRRRHRVGGRHAPIDCNLGARQARRIGSVMVTRSPSRCRLSWAGAYDLRSARTP